jgi:nitrite reductase/ring-hydroxylating ferredoxin subunit
MPLVPIGDGEGRRQWTIEHAGRCYAVFAVEGRHYVTDAACPHAGGPLAEGVVREGCVVCPWHWYRYELATGRCLTTPRVALRSYPVSEHAGELAAELPVPAPERSFSEILRAHAAGEG